jgi:bifunctional non-homologous end joining protein LigD
MQEQSISLYSRHAGANKQYHIYLRRSNDLWVVDFAHAAIGQTLKTGTKTAKPIPYEKALKKFNSLVKEKKEGESHYAEGPSGTAYQSPVTDKTLFGVYPQQPAAITRTELESLIDEPDWGFQEKANGENRTLRCHNGRLTGGNKKGFITPVPASWEAEFACLGDFVANGEQVADKFYAFDLLQIGSTDLRCRPQRERYEALAQLHANFRAQTPSFELLTCHYDPEAKSDLIATVEANRGEGIVAKDGGAAYEDGRNKKHPEVCVSGCCNLHRDWNQRPALRSHRSVEQRRRSRTLRKRNDPGEQGNTCSGRPDRCQVPLSRRLI